MDKELETLFKDLNKTLSKFIDKNTDKMVDKIDKELTKAHKEECKLSVEKDKKGHAQVKMEGSTLAILIALAGLEKTVLEKTHVPAGLYEIIKNSVGTKEA